MTDDLTLSSLLLFKISPFDFDIMGLIFSDVGPDAGGDLEPWSFEDLYSSRALGPVWGILGLEAYVYAFLVFIIEQPYTSLTSFCLEVYGLEPVSSLEDAVDLADTLVLEAHSYALGAWTVEDVFDLSWLDSSPFLKGFCLSCLRFAGLEPTAPAS